MGKSDVEKCVLSDKMLAYVIGMDGSADGGGWLKQATINPSIAHSILSYNTNNHRAGVDNYVCKELPLDTPVEDIRKIMEEPTEKKIGNLYGATGGNFAGNVYDDTGLAPSISTCGGGNQQPMIPSKYRIRKLTARECWRLMAFTDEEFDRAETVNSNTNLYKQAGNSIVVDVLVALFQEIINADGTINDHKGEQINLFDLL